MSNFTPAWFKKGFFNESLFCDDFLNSHQLLYSNGAFFTPDGRMVDPMPLRCEIFEMMREYVGANLAKKVTNVVDVLKLAAQVEDFPPVTDRIALANGTLYLDGTFQEGKPEIVRNRLPVKYDPKAAQPVHWLRFLSDLLYPEDIPTVQEFIGYEVKRGKHPSVKGKGQRRFIRFRTLGAGYTEEEIKTVLDGKAEHQPHPKQPLPEKKFGLLVDIPTKMAEGKTSGYKKWATKFNLKEMSKTLLYLQEKKIDSADELRERAAAATERYHTLGDSIKAAEKRMGKSLSCGRT